MELYYEGSYEAGEVSVLLKAMTKYPTAVFLDIGCNIGTYTEVMAATGREVVGVDAMLDNLAYIHTSLTISNTSHLVRLLHSPVRCSNSREHLLVHHSACSDTRERMLPVLEESRASGSTRLIPEHLVGNLPVSFLSNNKM